MLKFMPYLMPNIQTPPLTLPLLLCTLLSPVLQMSLLTAVKAITIAANNAINAGITITTLLRSNVDSTMALVTAPMKSFFLTLISLLLYPTYERNTASCRLIDGCNIHVTVPAKTLEHIYENTFPYRHIQNIIKVTTSISYPESNYFPSFLSWLLSFKSWLSLV